MKKTLLLFGLFLMSIYSFSAMTYKEREAFGKQWLEAAKKGDRETLMEITEKFIKEYPDEDYPYEYLGTFYMAKNDLKKAEKYLLKAVELGDKDTGLLTLAMVYYEQEDIKKGEETKKKIDEKIFNMPMNVLEIVREQKMLAVFLDNFNAQWFLADFYETHFKNNKEAKKWAKKALEKSKKMSKSEKAEDKDYVKKIAQIEKILE